MLSSKIGSDGFRWLYDPDHLGRMLFTFDGEKIYNLFQDYPNALTAKEKRIFDENNPQWVKFFNG